MDKTIPFYIEVTSTSGTTPSVNFWSTGDVTLDSMEISTDLVTWTTLTPSSGRKYVLINNATVGDKVYIRAKPTLGTYCTDESYGNSYGYYYGSSCHIKIGGNILSLFYGSNFTGNETSFIEGTRNCEYLFGSSNVDDASELILTPTTLTGSCYIKMFQYCRSLEKAPAIPQATITSGFPYDYMFQWCDSLESITIENTNIRNSDYILYGMAPKTIVYKKEGVTTPSNPNNLTVVTLKNTPFNVADAKQWSINGKNVKRVTDIRGRIMWGKPIDYTEPFYVENITQSTETFTLSKPSGTNTYTIEYSTDMVSWDVLGSISCGGSLTRTLNPGDKIYLRADTRATASPNGMFNITGVSKVGGNTMSLIYGSSFTGNETTFYNGGAVENFASLFANNTSLVNAGELLLPATTVYIGGYYRMFYQCSSLRLAPAILPATSIGSNAYDSMFYQCSSLKKSPSILASEIPSYGCDSMFYGCTQLEQVTCLCTSFEGSPGSDTNLWMVGVSQTGTFYKSASMNDWPTGTSGIPSGWTVIDL